MTKSNSFKAGEIVLIKFPFTDLSSHKQRPVLILSVAPFSPHESLLTVAMITSNIEVSKLQGDMLLKDWSSAGLLHPSILRLSKIATLDGQIVTKKFGKLSKIDEKTVKKNLVKIFSHWINL